MNKLKILQIEVNDFLLKLYSAKKTFLKSRSTVGIFVQIWQNINTQVPKGHSCSFCGGSITRIWPIENLNLLFRHHEIEPRRFLMEIWDDFMTICKDIGIKAL